MLEECYWWVWLNVDEFAIREALRKLAEQKHTESGRPNGPGEVQDTLASESDAASGGRTSPSDSEATKREVVP